MNIELLIDTIIYLSFIFMLILIYLFFKIENKIINYKWYPNDNNQDVKFSIGMNWQEGDEPIHDFEKKQFSN